MGFRITTNMMMNTYRYNLMNSTNRLADSVEKVQTKRNFNSYAEDPAAATQAFRLRRDWYRTQNQIANNKDVYSKFNTAHNNVQGMLDNLINPMEKISIIRGTNGAAGESRQALAQVLRESAESMIQGFNQQLGDHFVFAGNDGLNAPFEWRGEELYYRGINVNAGGVEKPLAEEPDWLTDVKKSAEAAGTWSADAQAWYDYYTRASDEKPATAEPTWLNDYATLDGAVTQEEQGWIKYYRRETDKIPTADEPTTWGAKDKYGVPENMPSYSSDPTEQGWIEYYKDQGDLAKLKAMSEEEMYIDLGMGAEENGANNPVRGTYFNSALSALNYTDFGVDEDGDPKNFAILMRQMADVFDTWDEDADPQGFNPELAKNSAKGLTSNELEQKAFRLMDKLKAAQETLTADHVELNARSTFLQTNQERLELQASELNGEIMDIEQVNLADAITNLSWDQMCYNAALKIGTQLLSQSLIDYMN